MRASFLSLRAGGLASPTLVSASFGRSQGGFVPSYTLIVREYLPAREAGGKIGFVLTATIVGMAFGGRISGSYDFAFYGAGLRASEVGNLKATDIDTDEMLIHVDNGEGGRDRKGGVWEVRS